MRLSKTGYSRVIAVGQVAVWAAGCLGVAMFFAGDLQADKTKISHTMDSDSGDILIQKNPAKLQPQFEIITEEEEIEGEPGLGVKAARANWKEACNDWKKEIRSDHPKENKDSQLISVSCGSAKEQKGSTIGEYTFYSNGKYKIKTRTKDADIAPAAAPAVVPAAAVSETAPKATETH